VATGADEEHPAQNIDMARMIRLWVVGDDGIITADDPEIDSFTMGESEE